MAWSNLVFQITRLMHFPMQILGAYVNAFRRGIPLHRHTQGKSTVLLYGPYDKEAVARGVADALKIRFESCNVLELIKEYPDDAVTAVRDLHFPF